MSTTEVRNPDEVLPDVAVEEPVEAAPKPRRDVNVEVMALSPMIYRNQEFALVVLVSDTSEAWLLPHDMVPAASTEPFKVKESVLNAAPRPVDLAPVVEELMPSVEEVVLSLRQMGVVTLEDLRSAQKVRPALNRALPSINSFMTFKAKD